MPTHTMVCVHRSATPLTKLFTPSHPIPLLLPHPTHLPPLLETQVEILPPLFPPPPEPTPEEAALQRKRREQVEEWRLRMR